MAILKPYETPQGVTGTYHKILKAEIKALTEVVEITIAVFASPEARAADRGVLWHEYVTIPFADLTQDPRDLLYPMLAAYVASPLVGGVPDAEGSGSPGNFEINLKPEFIAGDTNPQPTESTP